jgi:hypothetical protein
MDAGWLAVVLAWGLAAALGWVIGSALVRAWRRKI